MAHALPTAAEPPATASLLSRNELNLITRQRQQHGSPPGSPLEEALSHPLPPSMSPSVSTLGLHHDVSAYCHVVYFPSHCQTVRNRASRPLRCARHLTSTTLAPSHVPPVLLHPPASAYYTPKAAKTTSRQQGAEKARAAPPSLSDRGCQTYGAVEWHCLRES